MNMHPKTSRLALLLDLCLVWIEIGTSTSKANESCKPFNYRLNRATPFKCCVQAEPLNDELKQSCEALPVKCQTWCAFNTLGVYVNRKLDEKNLKSYLRTIYRNSIEMQTIALETFNYCAAEIYKELEKLPMQNYPAGDCPPDASLLQFCVHTMILSKCPAAIWRSSQECSELRDYMICRERIK